MNKVKSFIKKLDNYDDILKYAEIGLYILLPILILLTNLFADEMLFGKSLSIIFIIFLLFAAPNIIALFVIKDRKKKYLARAIGSTITFIFLLIISNFNHWNRWITGEYCEFVYIDKLNDVIFVCAPYQPSFWFVLFYITYILNLVYLSLYAVYNLLNVIWYEKQTESTTLDELQITSDEIIENDVAKAIITNENKYTNKKGEEFMEYRCITLGTWQGSDMNKAIRELEKLLNDLGKDGWTFVSIEEIKVLKGCINKQEIVNKILIVGR